MKRPAVVIGNGTVLTMDSRNTVWPQGFVHVQGDIVAAVGPSGSEPSGDMTFIDAHGGLILPGLINGHTHAAMSLFRGLSDDRPLMEWLEHYIFPAEQQMDAEFVYTGALLACAEMLLSGTTTFCDMYLFEEETARAAQEAGMRCILGEVLYDFPSPNYGDLENGFAYVEAMLERWREDPLITVAVEPHALFTCSPSLLARAGDLARRHDALLILHAAETRNELDQIRERYGKKPFEHLEDMGLLDSRFIAVHCVHLDEDEIQRILAHKVSVIHNPESNMKLASGVAPIPALLNGGAVVGLGTDGCASNNNLDLFSEMDTGAKLHKVHTLDPTVTPAQTMLRMATIEGARALGLQDLVGSLEAGKQADIIVVDTRRPHLTPLYDPFSQLVYAARGADVREVFVNGRHVVSDGCCQTLDVSRVMARAQVMARRVRERIS